MKRWGVLTVAVAVVILAGVGTAAGQSVNVEINETLTGTTGAHTAFSVVQTSDGGYAIAGVESLFDEEGGLDREDAWLVKTDQNGNVEMSETFGGAANDRFRSIVRTPDGGYALAGKTGSYSEGGGEDGWFVKTDQNGNIEANRTFGGTGNDTLPSMVGTSDGGYALAGQTESFAGGGVAGGWLVKTDQDGNVEVNRTFGGTEGDAFRSVSQTSDGGYALAGETDSYNGVGEQDAWLLKTDQNGNVEMNRTFGGVDVDRFRSVTQTSDGGYALAGVRSFSGADGFTIGDGDAWLVKTDQNGNVELNETFGGSGYDRLDSITETPDGGYALAGQTGSFSGGFGTDGWLVKADQNGNVEVNETFGGAKTELFRSVLRTSDGGYALVGWIISGEQNSPAWLVKTSGVSDGGGGDGGDGGTGGLSPNNPFGDQNGQPIGVSEAANVLFSWNQNGVVNGVQYGVSDMADFLFEWNQARR